MRSALEEVVREDAQRMLRTALEAEVVEFVDRHQHAVEADGHRQVVRNELLPERKVTTGAGPLKVKHSRGCATVVAWITRRRPPSPRGSCRATCVARRAWTS